MPGPGLDTRPNNGINPLSPVAPAIGQENLPDINSIQPTGNPVQLGSNPYANIDNWDEAAYANLFNDNAAFGESIKQGMMAEAMQPVAPPSLFGDMTKQEVALLAYNNAENPYTGEIFDRHEDTVSMDYFNQGSLDNYSGEAFENTDDIFKYTDSLDLNVDRRTFQGGPGGGEWQDYHSNRAVKNAAHEFVNRSFASLGKPPVYMDGNDVYVLNTGYGGNNPVLDPTIEGNNSDGSLGPKFTGHGGYYEPEGPEVGRGEYQKFVPQNKQGPDTDMLSDQITPVVAAIALAYLGNVAGLASAAGLGATVGGTAATVAGGATAGALSTAGMQAIYGDMDFDLTAIATAALAGGAGAYASTFGNAGNGFTQAMSDNLNISAELSGKITNVAAQTVLNGGDPVAAIKNEILAAGLDWGMDQIGEAWTAIQGVFSEDTLNAATDFSGSDISDSSQNYADTTQWTNENWDNALSGVDFNEEVIVTAPALPNTYNPITSGNLDVLNYLDESSITKVDDFDILGDTTNDDSTSSLGSDDDSTSSLGSDDDSTATGDTTTPVMEETVITATKPDDVQPITSNLSNIFGNTDNWTQQDWNKAFEGISQEDLEKIVNDSKKPDDDDSKPLMEEVTVTGQSPNNEGPATPVVVNAATEAVDPENLMEEIVITAQNLDDEGPATPVVVNAATEAVGPENPMEEIVITGQNLSNFPEGTIEGPPTTYTAELIQSILDEITPHLENLENPITGATGETGAKGAPGAGAGGIGGSGRREPIPLTKADRVRYPNLADQVSMFNAILARNKGNKRKRQQRKSK